jgi:hypothetical protein
VGSHAVRHFAISGRRCAEVAQWPIGRSTAYVAGPIRSRSIPRKHAGFGRNALSRRCFIHWMIAEPKSSHGFETLPSHIVGDRAGS